MCCIIIQRDKMTKRKLTLGIHSVSLQVLLAARLSNYDLHFLYTVDNVLPDSFTLLGQQNLKSSPSFQVSHLVENGSENSQADSSVILLKRHGNSEG